jgi:hypothetical protein
MVLIIGFDALTFKKPKKLQREANKMLAKYDNLHFSCRGS